MNNSVKQIHKNGDIIINKNRNDKINFYRNLTGDSYSYVNDNISKIAKN